jgi:hypothetical protein
MNARPLVADSVAKRFWVRREATLIQRIKRPRMIDSSAVLLGVDCCAPGARRRLLQQYRHKADLNSNYRPNRISPDGGADSQPRMFREIRIEALQLPLEEASITVAFSEGF